MLFPTQSRNIIFLHQHQRENSKHFAIPKIITCWTLICNLIFYTSTINLHVNIWSYLRADYFRIFIASSHSEVFYIETKVTGYVFKPWTQFTNQVLYVGTTGLNEEKRNYFRIFGQLYWKSALFKFCIEIDTYWGDDWRLRTFWKSMQFF